MALYGLGGFLVSRGLMPLRVLLSAIGFTFSLVFATQGCVQTFSDAQRALVSLARSALPPSRTSGIFFLPSGFLVSFARSAILPLGFWRHWPGRISLHLGVEG